MLINKLNGKDVKGCKFGLEVEVEGRNLEAVVQESFRKERDGSLRDGGLEFILKTPTSKTKTVIAYRYLLRELRKASTKNTGKAGIHVHVNVSDLTYTQVLTMYCALVCVEPCISQIYDETRRYSLFSLPVQYAENIIDHICHKNNFNPKRPAFWHKLGEFKYCNINLGSVYKNGTIELRGLETMCSWEKLEQVLTLLSKAREIALEYPTPLKLIEDMSEQGSYALAQRMLGDSVDQYYSEQECLECLRLIQNLAYTYEGWKNRREKDKEEPYVNKEEAIFRAFAKLY